MLVTSDEPSPRRCCDGEPASGDGETASSGRSANLATCTLAAVNEQAWRYGVRPGQSVAEAATFVGGLRIRRLARTDIDAALGQIAEVALSYGRTAATRLEQAKTVSAIEQASMLPRPVCYPGGAGAGPADTVWLDITGCTRLLGGEDLLCEDLRERIKELGYCARIAIADGPRIAQAVARWGRGELSIPVGRGAEALASLPLAALPLSAELLGWLGKLGIMHLGDLARLERARLAARLGPRAQDLLLLLGGTDDVPLVPYEPPRVIQEEVSFEHEVDGTEPLLFALGSLVSHAAVRLQARGEAASRVLVELEYDRSIARLRNIEQDSIQEEIELPVPLGFAEELLRTVRAKLEQLELGAPVRRVRLALDGLGPAVHRQLDLSRQTSLNPHALPTLLAELSAWLGPGRVGTLRWADSHRPEAKSVLVPVDPLRKPSATVPARPAGPVWLQAPEPTRLLTLPSYLGKLKAGELVSVDSGWFIIDRLRLDMRLDRVEWWTSEPLSRDYARAWLHTGAADHSASEYSEAWVFVDRTTGRGFLHGWFE